jgi:hypothetical protein
MSILGKTKFLQSLIQGLKTNRKIVIIESDDWGSERIPDNKTRESLAAVGIDMSTNPHAKFDTLERLEDLEALENLLISFKNEFNKKVRITTNFITGNPDYSKIEKSNFKEYSYEPFSVTYEKRDGHTLVFDKLKSLVSQGFLQPQFHGREHINAQFWLEALQNKNHNYLKAFKLGCYGIDAPSKEGHRKNLMAAFEYENTKQKEFIATSIREGMQLFEKAFGFQSSTIIAPRYVWNSSLENEFKKSGIKLIQTTFYQQEPIKEAYINKYHYTGQISKDSGLHYLVRNVFFEPAYSNDFDWVNQAFNKVKLAFQFHTPAIISMHRINFVGGLDKSNREDSLNQFQKLLKKIIETYPNVEFLSSDDLGKLIESRHVRN